MSGAPQAPVGSPDDSGLTVANNSPLSPGELRQVLILLIERRALEAEVDAQSVYIERLEDLMAREAQIHTRELQLEQRRTTVAEQERDSELRRADGLQELLDAEHIDKFCFKSIITVFIMRCN